MTDSSMLMSTEAATMPSIGVSNYEPLTRLGLTYEVFGARMSYSDKIVWAESPSGYTQGYPYLGGIQISMEPASGWSLGLNRLVQFGGGARGGASLSRLVEALINPSRYSNTNPHLSTDQKATNQEASVTSSLIVPARVPFVVYAEYAGEDTSRGRNYLLGNSALSWGINFPRLPGRLDLTLEASEWQNAWYVHSVWQDGMTNYGIVVSHWFGDQRVFNNDVGGHSAMARLGWDASFGGRIELRYRTLQNQNYEVHSYQPFHETSLSYSRPVRGVIVGGEFDTGSDVFGKSFSRVAGFVRYDDPKAQSPVSVGSATGAGADSDKNYELFVAAGVNAFRANISITELTPRTDTPLMHAGDFGLGARRFVSEHSDLGARVDFDEFDGHSLIGVRLIDYRYRFSRHFAVSASLGAARYDLATPAYGFYYAAALQWRDMVPHLDLGLEGRYYDTVARDRLLPGEPQTSRPDSFYDIYGSVLSLTYHF